MKIHITLSVEGREAAKAVIELEDGKLEPLSEDDRQAAVEIAVRSWADRSMSIEWETEGGPEAAE